MKGDRDVVITGIGLLTSLGLTREETWQGLVAGQSGIGLLTKFDASAFSTRIAAELKGFDPKAFGVDPKIARRMDPFIPYALAAGKEAVADARLDVAARAERVGTVVSSGIGGMTLWEQEHAKLLREGPRRISPFLIPGIIANMAAGFLSMELGAKGPSNCTVTACAASAHAVAEGCALIRSGRADAVVVGGAEASITPLSFAGFCSMRAMSTRNDEPARASRPFDAERDGFVMGEGAALLVLEARSLAEKRGAHMYARVAGCGFSSDAHHFTAPDPDGEGAERCMREALQDAGLAPDEVGYLNAHGTSTPLNDAVETKAIKRLFGGHARKLFVSSTKSMTGHMMGAAGAMEAAVCALAISRGLIPPTINLDYPDPECDLDYVPHQAREARVEHALSNSFGFGGHNASLVISRP